MFSWSLSGSWITGVLAAVYAVVNRFSNKGVMLMLIANKGLMLMLIANKGLMLIANKGLVLISLQGLM